MADVAVVGIGRMGGAMAARLAERGHTVTGFDVSDAARRRAEADGVPTVGSVAAAVADAGFVLTSLPDPAVVRSVWLGEDGVCANLRDGAVAIELSTVDPLTMTDVARPALDGGIAVIDCPVSGGPREARNGTLALLVGGDPAHLKVAREVLEDLGTVNHTGHLGTGKTVKIVNNMMSMGNVLVAAEAFALGLAAGVDPRRLYDVLSVSGGRSQHFTKRFPKALEGDFTAGFTLELGEKDLALAIELGRSLHFPTPVASSVREMYAIALAQGHRGEDIVALVKLYESWSEKPGLVSGGEAQQ